MEDQRSRSYAGFVAAIEIFAKYEKGGMLSKFIFEAEHDVIYSHVDTSLTNEEEGELLKALGWHEDSDINVWAYFT